MMDKDRLGNAIADRIITFSGNALSGADETQLRNLWKAIAEEIVNEIDTFAQLDLLAADIPVDPGTFVENLPVPGTPITGVGISQAVTLVGRIS